jgi:hypothetical protein
MNEIGTYYMYGKMCNMYWIQVGVSGTFSGFGAFCAYNLLINRLAVPN